VLTPTSVNVSNNDSKDIKLHRDLHTSTKIYNSTQWLNNSEFNTPIDPWFSTENDLTSDVEANISNGEANFIVIGTNGTFSNITGTPTPEKQWRHFNNSIFIEPDSHDINDYGCTASHEYNENVDQSRNRPSAHWRRNITMPVDMNEYNITSISISALVNGSANTNVEVESDGVSGVFYDYVRYYICFSNLDYEILYPIAEYQTEDLGQDTPPITTFNSYMDPINESTIIFYLNKALEKDNYNFGVTLGIDIYTEDNYGTPDIDTFSSLYINSVNISFNYEKLINKYTSVSWNQDGKKISNISDYSVQVIDANLNFKYKIDKNWTSNTTSPNSEIQIFINDNQHFQAIKLSEANLTYGDAKVGGIDVTNLIVDDVNLSLQVFIANDFDLNQNITISIDNATLMISYVIFIPDPILTGGNGGSSETKVISGADYTPIIIGLIAGIIALVAFFTAYQKHYKYPPFIRKIRKLKKTIKKGKKLKSLLVSPREEIIRNNFKNKTHQILEDEFLQSEKLEKITKMPNNKKINKKLNKGEK